MMNSRQYAIIQLLDYAESEPLTSAQLSAEINVSPKTIRNDIKELNSMLTSYDIHIQSKRGKGYLLRAKNRDHLERFFLHYAKKASTMIPVESEARVHFLMKRLLFHSDYIKIEDLLAELFVSRSTLQSDLKTVRNILQYYSLSIEHKPNYGMKVIGKEASIRFCISEYIFNQQPIWLEGQWLNILSSEELDIIREAILKNIRKHQITISDISLQNLMVHLAIAYKRIKENNPVQILKKVFYDLKDKKEYRVAQEILKEIECNLDVHFPKTEIVYLSIHLKGTKLTFFTNEAIDLEMDTKIYHVVQEAIQHIDKTYGLQLSRDKELLNNLTLHLKPAISRYQYQMNIRNPMLEEIKMKCPLSFEAALTGAKIIYKKLKIRVNEDEIGYIALHIEAALEKAKRSSVGRKQCLIVCASGLGSSQLLLHKLTNLFGQKLEVVGITEYYNLTQHSLEDIDFIVSTIPIREKLAIPVIHVSTILGDMDVLEIERVLENSVANIGDYILPEYTFFNYDFKTVHSIIQFLTSTLINDGRADKNYTLSVLERERKAPTSFGNLVAVPHPLEPGTNATFLSVLTLKKAITWGDKQVQLVILLNVNKTNKEELQPMFQSLVRLIDNKQTVFKLLACKTYAQMKNIIRTV
jgi:lichenan operon transcriptional antiterminator